MVEGVDRLAGSEDDSAEGFHFTARGGVGDDDDARHLDYEAVARCGSLGGDMPHCVREGRHHYQPAFSYGKPAVHGFVWNLVIESASETPDDRVLGPKKDSQALLFHRGVKAADDGDALVPESLGEVVGVKDEFAGTLDRAKQGDFRAV